MLNLAKVRPGDFIYNLTNAGRLRFMFFVVHVSPEGDAYLMQTHYAPDGKENISVKAAPIQHWAAGRWHMHAYQHLTHERFVNGELPWKNEVK